MANAKNMPVKYTYYEYLDGHRIEHVHDAWLEGVQGDGSAIIYIDGYPSRVSARALTTMDGDKLIKN
jgi:hypothetical protein